MLRLHVADQPDRCLLPIRIFFNLQCHLRLLRLSTVLRDCNKGSIRKPLKSLYFLWERLPNFQKLLNYRQKTGVSGLVLIRTDPIGGRQASEGSDTPRKAGGLMSGAASKAVTRVYSSRFAHFLERFLRIAVSSRHDRATYPESRTSR